MGETAGYCSLSLWEPIFFFCFVFFHSGRGVYMPALAVLSDLDGFGFYIPFFFFLFPCFLYSTRTLPVFLYPYTLTDRHP